MEWNKTVWYCVGISEKKQSNECKIVQCMTVKDSMGSDKMKWNLIYHFCMESSILSVDVDRICQWMWIGSVSEKTLTVDAGNRHGCSLPPQHCHCVIVDVMAGPWTVRSYWYGHGRPSLFKQVLQSTLIYLILVRLTTWSIGWWVLSLAKV